MHGADNVSSPQHGETMATLISAEGRRHAPVGSLTQEAKENKPPLLQHALSVPLDYSTASCMQQASGGRALCEIWHWRAAPPHVAVLMHAPFEGRSWVKLHIRRIDNHPAAEYQQHMHLEPHSPAA